MKLKVFPQFVQRALSHRTSILSTGGGFLSELSLRTSSIQTPKVLPFGKKTMANLVVISEQSVVCYFWLSRHSVTINRSDHRSFPDQKAIYGMMRSGTTA
jgi:hypothetical protein